MREQDKRIIYDKIRQIWERDTRGIVEVNWVAAFLDIDERLIRACGRMMGFTDDKERGILILKKTNPRKRPPLPFELSEEERGEAPDKHDKFGPLRRK